MAGAFEPEEFQGMLFHDGVDSQGRPVIVVNTDAVGTTRKARGQALQYMLHRLEPIVVQVLVSASERHACCRSQLVKYMLVVGGKCDIHIICSCMQHTYQTYADVRNIYIDTRRFMHLHMHADFSNMHMHSDTSHIQMPMSYV